MTAPSTPLVDCRVVGAEKLPTASGGADAFCNALKRAAASDAPNKKFRVDVQVRGASTLVATITLADGKKLPEQTFSISDRVLTKGSLERFAQGLVSDVVRAASH